MVPNSGQPIAPVPSPHYDYTAILDSDGFRAIEPTFQHVVTTYASKTNKTVSTWRAVPDELLDFKPHKRMNPTWSEADPTDSIEAARRGHK